MKKETSKLRLRRPTLADKETVLAMFAEFQASGSAMDGGYYEEGQDFVSWVEQNRDHELGLNLPDGFVPAIQYVSFDEEGQAIGFLHLRLRLNDYLLNMGGHIGYSIRPSQRRKGYAKELLKQGLQEALSKNIARVLVTCDENNEGSRRTILACGGVLEDSREGVERYWIEVEDAQS